MCWQTTIQFLNGRIHSAKLSFSSHSQRVIIVLLRGKWTTTSLTLWLASLSVSLAEAAAYYTASPASRELECAEDIYPQQSFSLRVVLIAERSKLVARAVQFRVPE